MNSPWPSQIHLEATCVDYIDTEYRQEQLHFWQKISPHVDYKKILKRFEPYKIPKKFQPSRF
jgi:hypothetical protein